MSQGKGCPALVLPNGKGLEPESWSWVIGIWARGVDASMNLALPG